MAARRPRFTASFADNLDSIKGFLGLAGAALFERLLTRLFDDVMPMLCRFPRSGRAFLTHQVRSTEAEILVEKLRAELRPEDDLRELVVDDYLLLYVLHGERVVLLAIRHHRQLAFDLRRFWSEP